MAARAGTCALLKDSFGRDIDYMRISVTDRCNLRCAYCLPERFSFMPHSEILSYEEISRVVEAASSLGICNYRITGGEPLVRKGVERLVSMMSGIPGVWSMSMTTNGVLLKGKAKALKDAGLESVTVSLDTLDEEKYGEITGKDCLPDVLSGIDEALSVGLRVKTNTVILPENLDEVASIASFFTGKGVDARFIELMPIGEGRNVSFVPMGKAIEKIKEVFPDLTEVDEKRGHGPAFYMGSAKANGRVGFIGALSHRYCRKCNRLRMTSLGVLMPCLDSSAGVDLKRALRGRGDDEEIKRLIENAVKMKKEGHGFVAYGSEIASPLSSIGG